MVAPLFLSAALQLFMDLDDPVDPWGLLTPDPTAVSLNTSLRTPNANYSGGATVFAAFATDETEFEVFLAIGRPGEPLSTRPTRNYTLVPGFNAVWSSDVGVKVRDQPDVGGCEQACRNNTTCTIFTFNTASHHCFLRFDGIWESKRNNGHVISGCTAQVAGCGTGPDPSGAGVYVNRYVTKDFVHFSDPVTVLFLPDSPPVLGAQAGDGDIWTVKSMDRNESHYLVCASGLPPCLP